MRSEIRTVLRSISGTPWSRRIMIQTTLGPVICSKNYDMYGFCHTKPLSHWAHSSLWCIITSNHETDRDTDHETDRATDYEDDCVLIPVTTQDNIRQAAAQRRGVSDRSGSLGGAAPSTCVGGRSSFGATRAVGGTHARKQQYVFHPSSTLLSHTLGHDIDLWGALIDWWWHIWWSFVMWCFPFSSDIPHYI